MFVSAFFQTMAERGSKDFLSVFCLLRIVY